MLDTNSLLWYSKVTARKDESNVQVTPPFLKNAYHNKKEYIGKTNTRDLTSEDEPQKREEHSLKTGSVKKLKKLWFSDSIEREVNK